MKTIEKQLKYIDRERESLLSDIKVAQSRLTELNTKRQNLIMSREE